MAEEFFHRPSKDIFFLFVKIGMYVLCNLHHFTFGLLLIFQVSVLADDILKNMEFDALRIIYNKFQSVVSFLPTVSTILSPEVISII